VKILRNSQGIALVVVLMLMVILLSITGASLLFSRLNVKTAIHFRSGGGAVHAADAGIQHALAIVNQGASFTYSAETTVLNTTIFGYGYSYSVTALNGPGSDQATFISTATGPNSSKAVITAVVQRRTLPPIPGALGLVGEAQAAFQGDGFEIDGRDYTLANSLSLTNPDKLGVSIGDISPPSSQTAAGAKSAVINALDSDQKDNVKGLAFVASPVTPSVDIDNSLSKQSVQDFVNFLKPIADSYVTVNSRGGDVSRSIRNSTDANGDLNLGGRIINMGTTSSPKIVFFDGDPAGTRGDLRLTFEGNITGAGILVMRDNDLKFLGRLDWKGLIIVTGPDTSITFAAGSDAQDVLGAVVVSETDTDGGAELTISSTNLRIRASRQALDLTQSVMNNKPSLKVVAWRQP